MTIEGLINSLPFITNLVIFSSYIIGTSATIFGFYDILHLKWTGDLKVMITALLSCSAILVFCELVKNGTFVSNAMLFTYGFMIVSFFFSTQFKNPKLSHGAKPLKKLLYDEHTRAPHKH